MYKNGFTKIELLAVLGFITLVIVGVIFAVSISRQEKYDIASFSGARLISSVIDAQFIETPNADFFGCVSPFSSPSECTGPGKIGELKKIFDPHKTFPPCQGAPGNLSQEPCSFSLSSSDGKSGAKTNDYQICFWLEKNYPPLQKGLNAIKTGGLFGNCD